MTTVVNSFSINGVLLTHQPTEHGWQNREIVGVDGNGHNVYVATREYQLEWDFLDATEFNEIYGYFLSVGNTGTAVVGLPQYPPVGVYQFYSYSGCVLYEPTYEGYMENYYKSVKLLIVKIVT